MTNAQKAAKNRCALAQQAQVPVGERFEQLARNDRHHCLLVIALLTSLAFGLFIHVLARLDAEAKPGEIIPASELTKEQLAEIRGNRHVR